MNIVALTSSRADYSIYLPLFKALEQHEDFDLSLIVFGSHTSLDQGNTIDTIKKDNFNILEAISIKMVEDSEVGISNVIGETIIAFSKIWEKYKSKTDLILCLGDRYEMFAAVSASIPFNLPIAHLYGGETTMGAIDNVFRNALTAFSDYHFVSHPGYMTRVQEIIGKKANVFNIGALSFDNIKNLTLYTIEDFYNKFHVDLSKPTILTTFHPETVNVDKIKLHAKEYYKTLSSISSEFQIVITQTNEDTKGSIIRKELEKLKDKSNIYFFKTLGTVGYLSCMKYCSFLLGNTSSGFTEAAYFPKWVINIGDRQNGRILGKNIIQCKIEHQELLENINAIKNLPPPENEFLYGDGNSASKIVNILSKINF